MTELGGLGVALLLVGVAIGISRYQRLNLERDLVVATVRALVQLSIVAALILFVFHHMGLTAVFLVVMAGAASWTSARRLKGVARAPLVATASICTASSSALLVLFGGGAFPLEPRYLIPIAGMLLGNTMTATSLAGARVRDDIREKVPEVEARLALGVTAREALKTYTRRAATTALIPMLDVTKNVGLIALPGAFVGMILGGSTPAEAARVQLIVLFMLLGAVAIAGMTATLLVARSFIASGERVVPGLVP